MAIFSDTDINRAMKNGEIKIHPLKTECTKPYKSKYSGQRGATVSKASEDYKH